MTFNIRIFLIRNRIVYYTAVAQRQGTEQYAPGGSGLEAQRSARCLGQRPRLAFTSVPVAPPAA